MLLPVPAYRGPDFEERLRESMDVEAMIEESERELRDYANQRIPLPAKNLSEKDEDLLKKVSMIASAVKVEEPPVLAPDVRMIPFYLFFKDQRAIHHRRAAEKRSTHREAHLGGRDI